MIEHYEGAIASFVTGRTSADEFETIYLQIFTHDKSQVPGAEYQILEKLFFAIEDYVADPVLRDSPEDLDAKQLKERAAMAYEQLYGRR